MGTASANHSRIMHIACPIWPRPRIPCSLVSCIDWGVCASAGFFAAGLLAGGVPLATGWPMGISGTPADCEQGNERNADRSPRDDHGVLDWLNDFFVYLVSDLLASEHCPTPLRSEPPRTSGVPARGSGGLP